MDVRVHFFLISREWRIIIMGCRGAGGVFYFASDNDMKWITISDSGIIPTIISKDRRHTKQLRDNI